MSFSILMAYGNKKLKKRNSGSAHYYMPESMPLVLCGACLILVLEYSEKAKGIFDQIVDSYRLPDISEMFDELDNELRNPSNRLKHMTRKEYEDSDMFGKWFDLKRDKVKSEDFKLWHGLIEELIRVGFNNEKEQAKGIYKINRESSPVLANVIVIRSLAQYKNVELVNDKAQKAIKIAGRTYDLTRLIDIEPTTRRYRDITKAYKKKGYRQHSNEKIAQIATYWYMSRVVYSGPTEFCNKALKNGIILDASNVSNEIKECDYAMGYTRGQR